MRDNGTPVSNKFCVERHKAYEKRMDDMQKWISKIDQKLWGGLVLLVAQLVAVIIALIKGVAH